MDRIPPGLASILLDPHLRCYYYLALELELGHVGQHGFYTVEMSILRRKFSEKGQIK